LVVAVGGNALQRRGDRLTIENMLVSFYIQIDVHNN
jgi:carbamate kinase